MGRDLISSNQPKASAQYVCNHSGRVDAVKLKALLSASAPSGTAPNFEPLEVLRGLLEFRFNNARPQGHAIYTILT